MTGCKCTDPRFVTDSGFKTCVLCGCVAGRDIDTRHVCYSQSLYSLRTTNYSRKMRFDQKILAALQRDVSHNINSALLSYLRQCKRRGMISTPEDLLSRMSEWQSARKPYIYAVFYWENLFNTTLPKIDHVDAMLLKRVFEEVFFAWERLRLPTPRIPIATCMQLIVKEYQLDSAKFLVRFTRKLRCKVRQKRYEEAFEKCLTYISKHGRQI